LQDVYGPTATEVNCQALICSEESIKGAESSPHISTLWPPVDSPLTRFVIQVITPEQADAIQRLSESGKEKLKRKLGSTAIRAWLAEQQSNSSES